MKYLYPLGIFKESMNQNWNFQKEGDFTSKTPLILTNFS